MTPIIGVSKKKKLSKVSQALELFSKNKTPIEVAIELDLDPKDVEKIYLNYLGLNELHQLVNIHQEFGNYLPDFISFYWSFREVGADNKKIKEILDIANRVTDLNLAIKNRQNERKTLDIQIVQKKQNLQYLDSQIELASNILSTEYSNLETVQNKISNCSMQLQNLNNLIKDIQNEDKYENLEKKVEDILMKIIDEKSVNLPLVLVAVFEALKNDPARYEIIFNYLKAFKNDNVNGDDLQTKENYSFANNRDLLHEINKIMKKLLKVYCNKIISEAVKTI